MQGWYLLLLLPDQHRHADKVQHAVTSSPNLSYKVSVCCVCGWVCWSGIPSTNKRSTWEKKICGNKGGKLSDPSFYFLLFPPPLSPCFQISLSRHGKQKRSNPTNNALLINFFPSSDAEIFVDKHRLSMPIGTQTCKNM